ncbi:hypothetical protein ACIQ7D_12875 [Streptomyces sp. NPDC096310]|uniref:hypothetical protein n=1 Tax=Streptomyces sp. NPDC096310 TaxID=3366082 RepID=UPI00381C7FD4
MTASAIGPYGVRSRDGTTHRTDDPPAYGGAPHAGAGAAVTATAADTAPATDAASAAPADISRAAPATDATPDRTRPGRRTA